MTPPRGEKRAREEDSLEAPDPERLKRSRAAEDDVISLSSEEPEALQQAAAEPAAHHTTLAFCQQVPPQARMFQFSVRGCLLGFGVRGHLACA